MILRAVHLVQKSLKAECLPKICEGHWQTLQQLMHLRKVYNCPLSCQNTPDIRDVFNEKT